MKVIQSNKDEKVIGPTDLISNGRKKSSFDLAGKLFNQSAPYRIVYKACNYLYSVQNHQITILDNLVFQYNLVTKSYIVY